MKLLPVNPVHLINFMTEKMPQAADVPAKATYT